MRVSGKVWGLVGVFREVLGCSWGKCWGCKESLSVYLVRCGGSESSSWGRCQGCSRVLGVAREVLG